MTTQSLVIGTTEILNMTNVSHATFYRVLFAEPTFPKPFKIGLRKNAWFRADVEAWINARAAGVTA
jgi:predicted DNA-binding transcriptional regulator AlpA